MARNGCRISGVSVLGDFITGTLFDVSHRFIFGFFAVITTYRGFWLILYWRSSRQGSVVAMSKGRDNNHRRRREFKRLLM
jgi:hypothetical protein